MEDIITNAYTTGGIGLALFVSLVWAVRWTYSQFSQLNDKIDTLKDQVTDLKVSQERYIQMIKNCSHADCPNKNKIA